MVIHCSGKGGGRYSKGGMWVCSFNTFGTFTILANAWQKGKRKKKIGKIKKASETN